MPVGLMGNNAANVPGNNLTLDSTSPWITYTGSWTFEGIGNDDIMTPYYWNSTYTTTTHDGDYFTFNWTGGDIYLYGAKRFNHNYYSVSLDGGEKQHFNGYNMYEHIDELLFTSRDLAQGEHSVTVTNEVQYGTPDPSKIYLDLDYILVDGVPMGMDPAQAEQMRLAFISSSGGTSATSASAGPTRASSMSSSATTQSSSSSSADGMVIVTDPNQSPRILTTLPAMDAPDYILDGSASSSVTNNFGLYSLLSSAWALWFIHKSIWR